MNKQMSKRKKTKKRVYGSFKIRQWKNPELAKTRFIDSLGADVKEETKI